MPLPQPVRRDCCRPSRLQVLSAIANLLNRGLPRSPRARQLCAELNGRSIAIAVRGLAQLRIASDGLTLQVSADENAADATLAGGPLALARLAGADAQTAQQGGGVTITGDVEIAEKFRALVQLLRPDLEEELSLVTGDVAAHQLARLAQGGERFARRAVRTTLTNLAEFLGHERGDLVPRNEGEDFLRGVDALREDVDRLQARLDLLSRRRGAP
jgi:ubiquinone biosynthesis accessory factor UbiJ